MFLLSICPSLNTQSREYNLSLLCQLLLGSEFDDSLVTEGLAPAILYEW